jgi:hypothetical protein
MATAVTASGVRRVSNRAGGAALKNDSVSSLINMKAELNHEKQHRLVAAYGGSSSSGGINNVVPSSSTSSGNVASNNSKLSTVAASTGGRNSTGAASANNYANYAQNITTSSTAINNSINKPAMPTDAPPYARKPVPPSGVASTAVSGSNNRAGVSPSAPSAGGPQIADISNYQRYVAGTGSSSVTSSSNINTNSNNYSASTAPGAASQQGSGAPPSSTIISNSGYNIVTSTANMLRRNSFGLLASASSAATAPSAPSSSSAVNTQTQSHTTNHSSESGAGGESASALPNGGGRPVLARQNSTTRQMINSMANMILSNNNNSSPHTDSSSTTDVPTVHTGAKKPTNKQVAPYDESRATHQNQHQHQHQQPQLSSSLNSNGTVSTNASRATQATQATQDISDRPESSRTISPNNDDPNSRNGQYFSNGVNHNYHDSSKQQTLLGRVGSAIGIKPSAASVQPINGPQPNSQDPNAPSGGGSTQANGNGAQQQQQPSKNAKLCCDKCDGKHLTEDCPHYAKNREAHPDAQKNFYKRIGGSSNLPGAYCYQTFSIVATFVCNIFLSLLLCDGRCCAAVSDDHSAARGRLVPVPLVVLRPAGRLHGILLAVGDLCVHRQAPDVQDLRHAAERLGEVGQQHQLRRLRAPHVQRLRLGRRHRDGLPVAAEERERARVRARGHEQQSRGHEWAAGQRRCRRRNDGL